MHIHRVQKTSITLLRLAMGGLFFYAGLSKILDSSWSAAGYLNSAVTLSDFYARLAQPEYINIVNNINKWALLLIGVSLILGIFVKYSSIAGIVLMVLYYLPALDFPYVGDHSFLIDEHVIYALVFLVLIYFRSGMYFGFDALKR